MSDTSLDWRRARSMAALKFRIIRHSPQVIVGMLLGLFLGGSLALGAISTIIRLEDHPVRGSIIMIGTSVLVALWLVAPLVLGGGELILDLKSLALYPLNLPTLMAGLLLAAVIGIPAFMTLLVSLSLLSHASGLLTAVVLTACAIQLTVTAVLAGRLTVAAVGLLASTRFRSVAGSITVLAAISLGISSQLIALAVDDFDLAWFSTVRRFVRFLPLGWTPEAIGQASMGNLRSAVFFLALGATVPLVLLILWRTALDRTLDGREAQIKTKRAKPLVAPWMDRMVDRRTAAVWAKSARAIRRDVREWTEIAAFLPLILAFALPTITELQARDARLVLVPFLAAVSGATMTSTNLFGGDGPRFTADAIPGDDFRPILLGKLLPRLILVAIIVATGAFILAWVMRGWRFLPVSLLLIGQSLMLGAAAGLFVTIRSPIPLPEKIGGFNATNAGCIAPLIQLGALAVADLVAIGLALPAIGVALAVSPWWALLCPVVTLPASWFLTRRRLRTESVRARQRIPQLAAALARRS
ncbi:MAG: hypothetical protein OES24_21715 [Acidimicrobiia bacterium]|nr:hypothetical protein [Acidimicrobiia bacterium]